MQIFPSELAEENGWLPVFFLVAISKLQWEPEERWRRNENDSSNDDDDDFN